MILPQDIQGYRLSLQQESWWQEKQNLVSQCSVLIKGAFSEEQIKDAVQKIVARHDILHTIYRTLPGWLMPLQVVTEQKMLSWKSCDLRSYNQEQLSVVLDEVMDRERTTQFDQEAGPLLSGLLAYLGNESVFLCLTMPSINADSQSLLLLLDELEAYLTDEEPAWLAEEPVQYTSYAEWQREMLSDPDAAQGRAFWQKHEREQNVNPSLPLMPEGQEQQFVPAYVALALSPREIAEMDRRAHSLNTTLEELLFACWHVFIWRLTNQPVLSLARVFDGRMYEELERGVGLYESALMIAHEYDEHPDLSTLLADLTTMCQEYAEWLNYNQPEQPSGSTSPASAFAYHKYTEGQVIELHHLQADTSPYMWKLSCLHGQDSLRLWFYYEAQHWQRQQIEYYARCFVQFLRGVIEEPAISLDAIPLLSATEQQAIREQLVGSRTEGQELLLTLFSRQVEQTPHLLAVFCEGRSLTYADLDRRSNQLAHYLIKRGVGPEARVGLCMSRSVDTLVALLGIWKAGGAYVPLDPETPKERIAFQLQDSEVSFILTEGDFLDNVLPRDQRIIKIDAEGAELAQESAIRPSHTIMPHHLAYIIYTSGSTGEPNGVCVEHQHLANYFAGIHHQVVLGVGATYATASTIAADLGNTMIFAALISGGCLHILTRDQLLDVRALATYFAQHQIDCLKIVPSHYRALLDAGDATVPVPRRLFIFGGEALPWSVVRRVQALAPDCEILNHYGPTETTIGVLTYAVSRDEAAGVSRTVPLGRPINNTRLYICDSSMHLVPVGVPGELYIGGESVARGYWKRSQLTAARYLTCPTLSSSHERLYKTGDLVRLLPNGTVEFLGRMDRQLKIHGNRVELSEIERVLERHPALKEAFVMPRDVAGEQKLVAYVTTRQPIDSQALSSYLQQLLPAYCIPAAFVSLAHFPLNKNGKRDIHALPEPDFAGTRVRHLEPPQTSTEQWLLEQWQQVLGRRELSIDDKFFEVGGNSMKSIQLLALLQQRYPYTKMADLFEYTTIRLMGMHITRQVSSHTSDEGEVESFEL